MAIKSNSSKTPIIQASYRLPSAGIPYLDKCPHFPDIVTIKSYSLDTEAFLLTNGTTFEKMRYITSKVVALPTGIDIDDLIESDEFTILAIARALTYGEDYTFRTQCPSCKHIEHHSFKVPDQMPTRMWDRSKLPDLSCKLPITKDCVEFKMLTLRDADAANKFVRDVAAATNSTESTNFAYVRRLAAQLKAVNGGEPTNIAEAEAYLHELQGPDIIAFTEGLDAVTPGIKYEWKVTCDKCHFIYEREVPITADFFRRNRK